MYFLELSLFDILNIIQNSKRNKNDQLAQIDLQIIQSMEKLGLIKIISGNTNSKKSFELTSQGQNLLNILKIDDRLDRQDKVLELILDDLSKIKSAFVTSSIHDLGMSDFGGSSSHDFGGTIEKKPHILEKTPSPTEDNIPDRENFSEYYAEIISELDDVTINKLKKIIFKIKNDFVRLDVKSRDKMEFGFESFLLLDSIYNVVLMLIFEDFGPKYIEATLIQKHSWAVSRLPFSPEISLLQFLDQIKLEQTSKNPELQIGEKTATTILGQLKRIVYTFDSNISIHIEGASISE